MKKEKSEYLIKSVSRALELLEQFRGSEDELGVSELSKRLRLQKNNVFRLLATLESCNYIEQNKRTDSYRLGIKSLEFGQAAISRMRLQRCSKPVMESLVRECNETCLVAIIKGNHIMYLDAVESTHPVRIIPRVGMMLPAASSAAGKVLLAGQQDEEHAVGAFPVHPSSVSERIELNRQLCRIAELGYALEDEEPDAGVRGVAAPIRDHGQGVVGAICVSGPAMRFDEQRMRDELLPLVIRGAAEISRQLGYSPEADLARIA